MTLEMNDKRNIPFLFVIFGGTGDLTKKKLIPAMYSLFRRGELSENFAIVSTGRKAMSEDDYRTAMKENMRVYAAEDLDEDVWNSFSARLYYRTMDFSVDYEVYESLQAFLIDLETLLHTQGNRVYYLAVAPEFFGFITSNLYRHSMLENKSSWQRIMVEKPFGTSLQMASELNEEMLRAVPEENIFRIDHYLGKEMVQNIIAIRFCNSIFESLWNHQYIDNIQIISTETIGIENRGSYYENAGILKDMLQNHILQMLSLICMEAPVDLKPESVRDEKVKVLKSLRLFDEALNQSHIVVGQYGRGLVGEHEAAAYREEAKVSPDSRTPTFIALKACVDNFRWGGVPIYIRAGKCLDKRVSEIVVQFKKLPGSGFFKEFAGTAPNVLVIRIQPSEGIYFHINAKKPGINFTIEEIGLDYCQTCKYDNNTPGTYERLILEAVRNNPSSFTRWDELEYSWKYVGSIERALAGREPEYPNYPSGSRGPKEADDMMEADGRSWWR